MLKIYNTHIRNIKNQEKCNFPTPWSGKQSCYDEYDCFATFKRDYILVIPANKKKSPSVQYFTEAENELSYFVTIRQR